MWRACERGKRDKGAVLSNIISAVNSVNTANHYSLVSVDESVGRVASVSFIIYKVNHVFKKIHFFDYQCLAVQKTTRK